jgi:hypothetical protein
MELLAKDLFPFLQPFVRRHVVDREQFGGKQCLSLRAQTAPTSHRIRVRLEPSAKCPRRRTRKSGIGLSQEGSWSTH